MGRGRGQRKSPPPFYPFFSVFPAGATSLPPYNQPKRAKPTVLHPTARAGERSLLSPPAHTLLSSPPFHSRQIEKRRRGVPPLLLIVGMPGREEEEESSEEGEEEGGKLKRVAHFKLSLSHFIFSSLAPLSTFPPFPRER